EVDADGTFVVTKVPETPGRVSQETVKEQLLYEMHDPRAYVTPDVTADITMLRLEGAGDDRGRVAGVTGRPRTTTLKVNLARLEGYSRELIFTFGWPRVFDKEEQLKGMLAAAWEGLPITRMEYTRLGQESLFGPLAAPPDDPLELIVRVMLTARGADTLKTAVRRAMALGLSGPAAMAGSR